MTLVTVTENHILESALYKIELTIFKKNKRLLAVCIPFNHFIYDASQLSYLSEKSHKPIPHERHH